MHRFAKNRQAGQAAAAQSRWLIATVAVAISTGSGSALAQGQAGDEATGSEQTQSSPTTVVAPEPVGSGVDPAAATAATAAPTTAATATTTALGSASAQDIDPHEPGSRRRLRPVQSRAEWKLTLSGFVQTDLVAWSQASQDELTPTTGEPMNETRFLIRRARIRAEAVRNHLAGAIEFDGNTINGTTARLLSAAIRFTPFSQASEAAAPLRITVGMFRVPFGQEVPSVERDKVVLEPPLTSRAFFPGFYDAGVMASGQWRYLRWAFAMVNGSPVADQQFRGRDPAQSFDFIGRIGAEVSTDPHLRFSAGLSFVTGRGLSPGTPPTKDMLQWVDANNDGLVQTTELQIVPGGPGRASQTFARNGFAVDASMQWCLRKLGGGSATVELIVAQNLDRGIEPADPIAANRELRELGGYGIITQALGNHVLIGGRYDRYLPDRDRNRVLGANRIPDSPVYSTLSGFAALLLSRSYDARLTMQYDHETNPLGRSLSGETVTRAADRFTIRAAVGF